MTEIETFDSLVDAVRATFPPSCRLIAVREHGDTGFALFNTCEVGVPYLYEVYYDRRDGRWSEGNSSNGSGWHRTDDASRLGVETLWGDAPAGAERVRAERAGQVFEEAVVYGSYLFTWWDVTEAEARVTAFRVNGEWVRAPRIW